jgi:hypothetical protein
VRRREARFCLFLHCDKYQSGYLSYLCTGNKPLKLKAGEAASDLAGKYIGQFNF